MVFWGLCQTHGQINGWTHDITTPWAPVGAKKTNNLLIYNFLSTYHNIYPCHSSWYICFCTCHSGFCSKSCKFQVYTFIYFYSHSFFWNQPCIFGDQIVGSCWYLQNDGVVSLQDIFVINEVVNLFTRYWCKMCYRQKGVSYWQGRLSPKSQPSLQIGVHLKLIEGLDWE